MPLYDGIGMIAEKSAVVFDIGAAFTKVGYAGECSPRAVVRSPDVTALDESALNDALVPFVHKLFFEYLLVNPKDRRVVLLEALIVDTRYVCHSAFAREVTRYRQMLSTIGSLNLVTWFQASL